MAVRAHANRNPAALMYDKPMSRRRLHGGALHQRAALPLRQLPRDRRRAGGRAGLGRAGPGLPAPAGAGARLRAGAAPPARVDGQLLLRRPADRVRPGLARRSCGRSPSSGPTTSTWRRSTTPSPRSSCCRSRATGSASGARRPDFVADGNLRWDARVAADQHLGRRALRGLRPRLQPGHRRRAPAARAPRPARWPARGPAWSPPARACPRARIVAAGGSEGDGASECGVSEVHARSIGTAAWARATACSGRPTPST